MGFLILRPWVQLPPRTPFFILMMNDIVYLNATTVSYHGKALAIMGQPAGGKSTLALLLIQQGWKLVADDLTYFTQKGRLLYANVAKRYAGVLFIRGQGFIKNIPTADKVPLVGILYLGSPYKNNFLPDTGDIPVFFTPMHSQKLPDDVFKLFNG